MRVSTDALVDHYRRVFEKTIRGLPIVNDSLDIEVVGFRALDEHKMGALITPWFMNLVLLPGTERWDNRPQGSACKVALPGGNIDFRVSHERALGTILSAPLFSTVADFPDQEIAREVAQETLRLLFTRNPQGTVEQGRTMSRRQLLKQLGSIAGDER